MSEDLKQKKTPDQEEDDWLLKRESSFIIAYWRKNHDCFVRQTKDKIDPRLNYTDAISVAAELGMVDVLEKLLDTMATSDQELGADGKSKIEQCLTGEDQTGQPASMFGQTPLHKAAYR